MAIFSSDDPSPEPDPVIYLEGGPGGDALETVPLLLRGPLRALPGRPRRGHVRPAGTGYSSPRSPAPKRGSSTSSCSTMCSPRGVRCPPDRGGRSLPRPAPGRGHRPEPVRLGFVVGGRRRPGTSPRLRRWNLYGISYGTRLALAMFATTQITSAASSSTRPTPLGRCPHRVPRERRAVIRRVVRRLCG